MKRTIIFTLVSFFVLLSGQTKRDPRVVGLSGAYTTIANGIFCVGYNPALITRAHDKPFMMQFLQYDNGFLGNFLSIENFAQYSGDTLETNEKDKLFENFEDGNGLAFFRDRHLPMPLINYSKGNIAFTSNMVILSSRATGSSKLGRSQVHESTALVQVTRKYCHSRFTSDGFK